MVGGLLCEAAFQLCMREAGKYGSRSFQPNPRWPALQMPERSTSLQEEEEDKVRKAAIDY